MTAKQLFEHALVELNKKEAPSLLLEDYNYFINKAINAYVNKMYNAYDINQQKTDDLRVLKSTAVLSPVINDDYPLTSNSLFNKTYEVNLPDDYLHALNCIVEYDVLKRYKCYDSGDKWQVGATRMTSDMYSQIINNYYLRPTYKSPYFYINNVSVDTTFPTSDSQENVEFGEFDKHVLTDSSSSDGDTVSINGLVFTFKTTPVDQNDVDVSNPIKNLYKALVTSSDILLKDCNFKYDTLSDSLTIESKFGVTTAPVGASLTISSSVEEYSNVEKNTSQRYGNVSKVRMEIRYGKDDSIFKLDKVYVDYLKSPKFVRLTKNQVDEVEDNSQVIEFPDYVCQEIINELVWLLLENSSDQRINTHGPINQTIANPVAQQQAQ